MTKLDLNIISNYYQNKIETFGDTPRGVDWNSSDSQNLRFHLLSKIITKKEKFSIIDYGCGTSSFLAFLKENGYLNFKYYGFDINNKMLDISRAKFYGEKNVYFESNFNKIPKCDFLISSGLFNVKLNNNSKVWEQFIFETISKFDRKSKLGFSFNMLNDICDSNKKKDYLYYANPGLYIEFILNKISRNLTFHSVSEIYDFTLTIK